MVVIYLFTDHYGNGMDTGDVRVEIHSGLTSSGTIVGTLFPTATGIFRDYDDPQGFYIRLRGQFRNPVTFKMAFTSYNDFYTSGMSRRPCELLPSLGVARLSFIGLSTITKKMFCSETAQLILPNIG